MLPSFPKVKFPFFYNSTLLSLYICLSLIVLLIDVVYSICTSMFYMFAVGLSSLPSNLCSFDWRFLFYLFIMFCLDFVSGLRHFISMFM